MRTGRESPSTRTRGGRRWMKNVAAALRSTFNYDYPVSFAAIRKSRSATVLTIVKNRRRQDRRTFIVIGHYYYHPPSKRTGEPSLRSEEENGKNPAIIRLGPAVFRTDLTIVTRRMQRAGKKIDR